MGNLLYLVAVILIVGWLLGFVFYGVASPIIHLLLVIAVIAVLFQFISGRRRV